MQRNTMSPEPRDNAEISLEHAVFGGLTPRGPVFEQACNTGGGHLRKTLMGSLPLLMTGTLATSVIGPPGFVPRASDAQDSDASGTERLDARPGIAERLQATILPAARAILSSTRPDLPNTYTVQAGDSVSSIADRFGIPTPAILTLNGLSWATVLHEGQVLKLSAEPTKKKAASPARVSKAGYIVQYGDSVSVIAAKLGISTSALLTHNNLDFNAAIYPGQFLKVPGATVATVSRDVQNVPPSVIDAPRIIPTGVSQQSEFQSDQENPGSGGSSPQDIFDAADIPLVEMPALVTVKVTPRPVRTPAQASPAQPAATPNPSPPASTVGQPVTGAITPLNDKRRANARIIVSVGRELGVPDYGIVIALATAMQESSLRNINWGDRDSVGLFQQRPSSGWGTAEQILDPAYSTRLFFGGPLNPNRGRTRGLLDVAGWQKMSLTQAAQRVQVSAFPGAYAKWEPSAWAWLYELN